MSKTTDEKPQPEPVKWIKLTNEHGNIMEVPPQHVADNTEDKKILDKDGNVVQVVKAGWKLFKE